MDVTVEGQTYTSTVYMKNLGTSTLKIRGDSTILGQTSSVIIDVAASKVYAGSSSTGWIEYTYDSSYSQSYTDYQSQLSGWTSGDYTYTDPTTGYSVRIYNVQVNPTLADSLFVAS